MLLDADAALYLYLTVFATAGYFAMPPGKKGAICKRSSWVPVWAIKVAKSTFQPGILVIMCSGCVLASSSSAREYIGMRAFFALAVFMVDLHHFHRYGCHQCFIVLYSVAALVVPPGAGRDGIFRVVTMFQLFAAGVSKIRVGGFKRLHPESSANWMQTYLCKESCTFNPVLENPLWIQNWLLRIFVANPRLTSFSMFAALVIEFGSLPLGLAGGPWSCMLLFGVGTAFHAAMVLMTGINFVFHPAVYAYALLRPSAQDPQCVFTGPALVVLMIFTVAVFYETEDWPFSSLALFPYNYCQVKGLAALRHKFALALQDELNDNRGCKAGGDKQRPQSAVEHERTYAQEAERMLSIISDLGILRAPPSVVELIALWPPSYYEPHGIRALGGAIEKPNDPVEIAAARERVEAWLRSRRPFLDGETLEPLTTLAPAYAAPMN